nr:vacuolar protein sorting associated protein 25 [Hymenolepis microstoma]CUU98392.1 vacuolar protein sorting associated protein 25 [Hymenolepis microstoma]
MMEITWGSFNSTYSDRCAADIGRWVRSPTVCTICEIIDGDNTEGESFHGIDQTVIMEALRYLEKHGKAEIIDGGEGVKFFI